MTPVTSFAWQHDPESLGHGEYTFFDNESAGVANTGTSATAEFGLSRADRVILDERHRTATPCSPMTSRRD